MVFQVLLSLVDFVLPLCERASRILLLLLSLSVPPCLSAATSLSVFPVSYASVLLFYIFKCFSFALVF